MTNVARILVQGGTLTFDAGVPYDQQMLFEHANRYATRQGSITLDLDGVEWSVSASMRQRSRCTNCSDRLPALSYAHQRRVLCPRCARRLCLVPNPHTAPASSRKPPRRREGRALLADDAQRRPPGTGV